ncbi:chaplin [Streptomyces huasconensis]|uniref:chaplin n=1 Tax=Streptomyces huasconensis TaxID=1854574 RepID=UPI0036FBC054
MNSIAKKAALAVVTAGLAAGASAGVASAAASAEVDGVARNSPGVGSGNLANVPAQVPVNATGNSANVIGALNPTFGDASANH